MINSRAAMSSMIAMAAMAAASSIQSVSNVIQPGESLPGNLHYKKPDTRSRNPRSKFGKSSRDKWIIQKNKELLSKNLKKHANKFL